MPCPHRRRTDQQSDDDDSGDGRGIDRRSFVKSALAIGGTSAVTSLGSVAGITTNARAEPTEPVGVAERLNRQHAWDAFEAVTGSLNTKPPHQSLFLFLDYRGEGRPSAYHRRQVEEALSEIERNFEWNPKGVLFTMAYSADYFDRFEEDPPAGARPMPQAEVAAHAEAVTTDDEVEAETHEALLLLSSDNVANLLAVEEALWGNDEDLDVSFDATFEGVFERPREFPSRRVGFLGPELPKDRYAEEIGVEVPEDAPLSMGFIAGFDASMPEEDAVTLERDQQFPAPDVDPEDVPEADYVGEVGARDPGVFAQGTLKHVSHITLDLESWYDKPHEERRTQMYSPYHTAEDVGEVGENLTDPEDGDPGADEGADGDAVPDLPTRDPEGEDYANRAEQTAAWGTDLTDDTPTLGHSQKAARARYDVDGDGELEQPVLRRDWPNIVSADESSAGYHFNVPMRFNESALSMFEANYNLEFTSLDGRIDHGPVYSDQWKERNGIAPFMEATVRGHFLVPPVRLRALPAPRAHEATVEVERDGDRYLVDVEYDGMFDVDTVQFGAPRAVDQGRGASPVDFEWDGGDTFRFEFAAGEAGLGDASSARLFAKTAWERHPVTGTAGL